MRTIPVLAIVLALAGEAAAAARGWQCGAIAVSVEAEDMEDPGPRTIHVWKVPLNVVETKGIRVEWRRDGRMYLNGKQCRYTYPETHGADPKDLDKFGYPKR
jgi:hypothetical protein